MSITNYYVRATNGADVAGQGTTHATAYKTVQFALDDIGTTHGRNAVDGDQINICDSSLEGANVLAATLTLATYGTPTGTAPLILRGYTATANDGGRGTLDRNAGTTPIVWGTSYLHLLDLRLTNTSSGTLIAFGSHCSLQNCIVDKVLNAASGAYGVTGSRNLIQGCQFYNIANNAVRLTSGLIVGNYIVDNNAAPWNYAGIFAWDGPFAIVGNIIVTRKYAIQTENGYGILIANNILYGLDAPVGPGVFVSGTYPNIVPVYNNIICGFSGVGGIGISYPDEPAVAVGHNAFWNNTNNLNFARGPVNDLGQNVILSADPFTDAPNGDFSLTDAAKAALAAKGWPQSYLGAHANTVPNLNIGPIQMAAGSGGGVVRRAMRILGG